MLGYKPRAVQGAGEDQGRREESDFAGVETDPREGGRSAGMDQEGLPDVHGD